MERYTDIHKEIIEACMRGDERQKYKLYQLYSKAMFNVCFRIMNHREEAEDMLQEAFTQAFLKLKSFRFESAFGAWLKRIVVNTCINEKKRKKVEFKLIGELHSFDKPEHDEQSDENLQLTIAGVSKAMEKLPEGGKMIFSLFLFEGYDHGEIAQILNISESTSKSQFMRAKRRVIEILNEKNWKV